MSSLRNIKNHIQCVNQNKSNGGKAILATDQVQLVATTTVPSDANLANGRLYYLEGTGLRAYIESSWVTLGAGGASSATWNSLYDAGKTLTVDETTFNIAGTAALAAGDVLTVTATAGVTGDCIQITNSGTGSDIKGTSNTWSVSKAGAAVFVGITPGGDITATAAALDFDLKDNQSAALTFDAGAAGLSLISLDTTNDVEIVTVKSALVITGAQDLATITATNNSAIGAAAAYSLNGSGAYAGVTTKSFLYVAPTGLTTGTAVYIGPSAMTDGKGLEIEADTTEAGILLSLKAAAGTLTTGSYLFANDGAATFNIGIDMATTITTAVNSTVALTVTGIQTNEDMVKFSSNGVTATGQATLLVTAAGATAAGSAVLLVNATGTPASATSYLAVFDYETATEATNDPITVEIRTGTSIGAAINIIDKATTATGGVLNFTCAEATTAKIIKMEGLVALTTGNAISIAHTTSAIAEGGCLVSVASSGVNTGATIATVMNLATTGQLAGTMVNVSSIQTTGTVMSIVSTGIMTTTGNLLTLTANAATTAAGLLRVNANGLTSGNGVVIASSSTAITSGSMFLVSHSGVSTTTALAPLSVFSSAAADNTTIVQIIDASDLAAGVGLDISLAATTTGTGIDMGNFSAVTTGKGIFIDNDASTLTSGYLIHLDSASTAMTTGRLLLVDHTGNATATAMCSIAEIKSAATENTVLLSLTASAALAGGIGLDISVAAMTTGTALDIGGMAAITTGNGIVVAASGTTRTDGMLLSLSCASTAATSTGRMLLVNHTGATGVSTVISEVKTAAGDETVAFLVTASGALALGKAISVIADSCTTGFGIDMTMDALTTGVMINAHSDSADVTARSLVHIHNDNAAAVGTVPLEIVQDSPATTHFYAAIKTNSNTIWVGDGTTPNAALAATTGDILINGDSGKPYYCTNGAGSLWTALV